MGVTFLTLRHPKDIELAFAEVGLVCMSKTVINSHGEQPTTTRPQAM